MIRSPRTPLTALSNTFRLFATLPCDDLNRSKKKKVFFLNSKERRIEDMFKGVENEKPYMTLLSFDTTSFDVIKEVLASVFTVHFFFDLRRCSDAQ